MQPDDERWTALPLHGVSTAANDVVVNVPLTRTATSFFSTYTEYAIDVSVANRFILRVWRGIHLPARELVSRRQAA